MRCKRFFLLLFLIPSFIYASSSFYLKECEEILNKITFEWNRHFQIVEQFDHLSANEKEIGVGLLLEAINCCNRATEYNNKILKKIADKPKEDRRDWVDVKGLCEKNKSTFNTEIVRLQNRINDVYSTSAFEKANSLFQESEKKVSLANAKCHDCPRHLNNVDAVVSNLNEVAKLYEEAASIAGAALNLISPYPNESSKALLKQTLERYQESASKYKKEAEEWPTVVLAQKIALNERLEALKEDRRLFEEKELKRSSYEVQKQMLPILEQLIESSLSDEAEIFKQELTELKNSIAVFEAEADSNRLTKTTPLISQEEFRAREKERRELFFKSDFLLKPDLFLQSILHDESRPLAIALDGQVNKKDKNYTLYTEQFYRFLVQSDTPVPELLVKVYEKGKVIYEEKIAIPLKNTLSWERYLRDGMVLIPETKLKAEFGLDLRLSFVCDPMYSFSMIVAQKCIYSKYQFSISLDEGTPVYECQLLEPPPWQLGVLKKSALTIANKPIGEGFISTINSYSEFGKESTEYDLVQYPILDQFIEQLKGDPLLLAQYVYHEIALVDPFLKEENGVFQAPGIHRSPLMTHLEKKGSPWEQCQLLVYLLRKAGYRAGYAKGDPCSLPRTFVEQLLLTKIPEEQKEALLNYPWVVFFDGKETIPLFPWMKEIQIHEGYDLYNFMPEEYASADRWILRYLKGDERILKHIDGDDTAAILFPLFVQEELRTQGLSLNDVGIHRSQLKKQFVSWKDCPRPSIQGNHHIFNYLGNVPGLFAYAIIEVCSHENPQKKLEPLHLSFAMLNCSAIPMRFSADDEMHHRFHIGDNDKNTLTLDPTDQHIDIKINYRTPVGSIDITQNKTFSIAKGTAAALCFHFGGATPQVTSKFYEEFTKEKEEHKRLSALLAYVGAAYFEKCSRGEQTLAELHKMIPRTVCAFGLAKLAPDVSKGTINGIPVVKLPQVDMIRIISELPSNSSINRHQEVHTAYRQWKSLTTVDQSSNEHQILREVFDDLYAISTVKLLQLAHQQQQKNGLPEEGFLVFTPSSFEAAEKTPEAAQGLYFSHLKDLNLREVKATSFGEWDAVKKLLEPGSTSNNWAYAYMTPGLTFNQNASYKEMGALIFHPDTQYALISNNNFLLNGGLGSPLPASFLTPIAISQWELIPRNNSYTLHVPSPFNTNTPPLTLPLTPERTQWSNDVRLEHKSFLNTVGDPVDIVTGAFYVDEVDLILPGSFPLEIRRNYNNQNPLVGDLGCGWKLSLNPYLIEQDGKLYAAEADGTIIVYSFNQETSRWEIFPEENPDLCNFNQKGIGSTANPFHAYIENDILYSSDGSKRYFEDGLLQQWVNAKGNTLTFSYSNRRLSRIESSNGDFCGLLYNHEDKITEIYARDGRRISYTYNSRGDLITVVLPNAATISYEYDKSHRIIRETRPHGHVIENRYDLQGRVIEQRSPMGLQQAMVISATFDYQDGLTTVTDAEKGQTTYKIFQKQIYKITDPLGHQTLQSWFIDEKSWFDPESERIVPWNQPGGWPRSLKSTTDKRGLTTYYLYDSQGNPEEIGLKGDDLTGSQEQCIAKKLIYNSQNLCIEEDVSGQKTVTTYDSTFPYIPKRIEKFIGDTLLSYIDLEYNTLGQIIKEDHSGTVNLWKYDTRGFPIQKTQVTGTDDPDVITIYSYNNQGQCIQIIAADSIQENVYDIMGNTIQSQVFSPSGTLLSATYLGYDLNNQPIWKQTAHSQNTVYLDYNASGRIKASRQNLSPSHAIAYTLYEYDARGYLIQEVNPLGYCTYRDYDALGKITCETMEGHSTHFSYEPGGLVATITSPSGAQTTRLYTTNGLLKEEHYPDGTQSSIIYDFFGRPIREINNGIAWEITYDDPNHRVIRTHLETKASEIHEFDARGNLIRFIDAAGNTSEKNYDGLGRVKTETSPSGELTTWNYKGNTIICTLPSGETRATRYEAGTPRDTKVFDHRGNLIAHSSSYYDPVQDIQTTTEGEDVTVSWLNAFGRPIRIQKGDWINTYEYDYCGNCIASIDGEERSTHQMFDGLGRMIQKELPDGSLLEYAYDPDSNLIECRLPNGVLWKASYDAMGRKSVEELQAGRHTSQRWEYIYENGYLKETKDPLQRTHTYLYDPYGRLAQENVDGWRRTYTYDPRGLLATAEQKKEATSSWFSSAPPVNSKIERSYDASGRLASESIYLNSELLQHTVQTWSPSERTLEIDNHRRNFVYQNSQLIGITSDSIDLAYQYALNGALRSKTTPFSTVDMDYHLSGLPENIQTRLPEGSYQESLEWNPSGKLSAYSTPRQHKQFTYTSRGYLQSAGAERYEFDGTGVRTAAPNWHIPQDGLDAFNKIVTEISDTNSLTTTYNQMGEVTSHNQRQFEWDPWGRLLKVTDGAFSWEASYDAFGRRLQTRYNPSRGSTLTMTSFYDPEEEFQEIGIQYAGKTFWKLYGPVSCDAIIDETGTSAILVYNALGHLAKVVSQKGTLNTEHFPSSSYGPQTVLSFIPTDLLSYAQSLTWHSKGQDPTGLIWMGARYYDPRGGRFISPDPVGHPICLDLYAYAGGDPVNYIDPDGRFFSSAYQTVKPVLINAWNSPYFQGSAQALGGLAETGFGSGMTLATGGIAAPFGWSVMAHGLDQFFTGMSTVFSGRSRDTVTSQLLQKTGISPQTAGLIDSGLSMGGSMIGAAAMRFSQLANASNYLRVPTPKMKSGGWVLPEKGGGAFINSRWYTEHALERMAPNTPQVMAKLESRALERANALGLQPRTEEFGRWMYRNGPNPRGIPPSVIEAEIAHPGTTGIRVILNENGDVITVIPGGK